MKIFNLPDLGEGLTEAEIHEWHVKVGDDVKTDDPLVSMETAKAVVDVPSPYCGKIIKLNGKTGDIIPTGAALVEFETGDATETKDSGTVAGKIEVGNTVITENATGITPTTATTGKVKIIPAVRALAKKLNVDIDSITPSNPNMLTADDVKKAASTPAEGFEPLKGVRRHMATLMSQSHAEVVPVTIVDDADIHAWPEKTDITMRIVRAIQFACETEPALNAHYQGLQNARKVFDHVNLGIAMDSEEGLFVPVLKDIANNAPKALRETINRFKEQVSTREIPQEDLKGATITLSNFGTFAGRYASPIVIPPMVAIVGSGKLRQEVILTNDKPESHRIMPLSLTFDHRAVTGGEAARFLQALIQDLTKAN